MTDEGGGLLHKNGLVMVITSPSSVFSPFGRKATRCGKRIGARLKKPSRLAFSYASRPTGGEKAFGSALPSNVPRLCSFPYEGKVPRSGG